MTTTGGVANDEPVSRAMALAGKVLSPTAGYDLLSPHEKKLQHAEILVQDTHYAAQSLVKRQALEVITELQRLRRAIEQLRGAYGEFRKP